MDCQMPEVDGFAATRAIRAIQARDGGDVRIIAMTANAMEGDRTACIEAGMDDYLSKPVELDKLRDALRPIQVAAAKPVDPQDGRSSHPTGAARVLDFGRLRQVFVGDDEAIRETLELTIAECRPLVGAIQAAVIGKESIAAVHATHKFKGICGNVGANELAAIVLHIERAVKSEDWPAAQVGCNDLGPAMARFDTAAAKARSRIDLSPLRTAL
jgi:HPt (histidine-containing phosphotransfer) domain-containing protein